MGDSSQGFIVMMKSSGTCIVNTSYPRVWGNFLLDTEPVPVEEFPCPLFLMVLELTLLNILPCPFSFLATAEEVVEE